MEEKVKVKSLNYLNSNLLKDSLVLLGNLKVFVDFFEISYLLLWFPYLLFSTLRSNKRIIFMCPIFVQKPQPRRQPQDL